MFRTILTVAAAVLIGDFAASWVLPKLHVTNDPNSTFDAYDIGSALIIGATAYLLHSAMRGK